MAGWAADVLLRAGGATSLFSSAFGGNHVVNGSVVDLPTATWVLAELFFAPPCLTCTGDFSEFERAAYAVERWGNSSVADGDDGQIPVRALNVDCSLYGSLCKVWGGSHRNPYESFIYQSKPKGGKPPEGWLSAWSTSFVILGQRSDFLDTDAWVPTFWRLDTYDSAEEVLDWVRTQLESLPVARVPPRLADLRAPPPDEFTKLAVEYASLGGDMSDHGCWCKPTWTSWSGGVLGKFQLSQTVHGCPVELRQCETLAPCLGQATDSCQPGRVRTFPPALKRDGAEVELAAALLLRIVWEQAEFETDAPGSFELSVDGAKRRSVLLRFFEVLCHWFPSDERKQIKTNRRRLWPWSPPVEERTTRCRSSFCELPARLQRNWNNLTTPVPGKRAVKIWASRIEEGWRLCDRLWMTWGSEQWHQCRGTFAGTRQVPCGIWVLLHSVFAHAGAGSSNAGEQLRPRDGVAATRDFLLQFLPCPMCVRHLQIAPYDLAGIGTPREAVLWLWNTHNFISRVIYERPRAGRAFATDPAFRPTMSWPPPALCAGCLLGNASAAGSAPGPSAPDLAVAFDLAAGADWGPGARGNGSLLDAAGIATRFAASNWNYTAVFEFLLSFYAPGVSPEAEAELVGLSERGALSLAAVVSPPPAVGSARATQRRRGRLARRRLPESSTEQLGRSPLELAGETFAASSPAPAASPAQAPPRQEPRRRPPPGVAVWAAGLASASLFAALVLPGTRAAPRRGVVARCRDLDRPPTAAGPEPEDGGGLL